MPSPAWPRPSLSPLIATQVGVLAALATLMSSGYPLAVLVLYPRAAIVAAAALAIVVVVVVRARRRRAREKTSRTSPHRVPAALVP